MTQLKRFFPTLLMPGGLIIALGLAITLNSGQAGAAQAPLDLGTATSFAVLGGAAVTNTGPSVISGNLGVSPETSVTGIKPPATEPGLVINGTVHAADAVAAQAQLDESTAYTVAAGGLPVTNVATELGGTTLVGGVYASGTLGLTGTLTLNGDANAVWIFKAVSTLITSSASRVVLTGGASACNVFWQVGSSATLASATQFVGTVLAQTSITAETDASVQGRLFAQTGAVTLDTNAITAPTCTTTTTPPPSSSPPASSAPAGSSSSGSTGTLGSSGSSGTLGSSGSSGTLGSSGSSSSSDTLRSSGSSSSSGIVRSSGSSGIVRSSGSSATATTATQTTGLGGGVGGLGGGSSATNSGAGSHTNGSGGSARSGTTGATSTTAQLAVTGRNIIGLLSWALLGIAVGGALSLIARRRTAIARHRR